MRPLTLVCRAAPRLGSARARGRGNPSNCPAANKMAAANLGELSKSLDRSLVREGLPTLECKCKVAIMSVKLCRCIAISGDYIEPRFVFSARGYNVAIDLLLYLFFPNTLLLPSCSLICLCYTPSSNPPPSPPLPSLSILLPSPPMLLLALRDPSLLWF